MSEIKWSHATGTTEHSHLWSNCWWPGYEGAKSIWTYIVEYWDEPHAYYITYGSTDRPRIVSGPFPDIDTAKTIFRIQGWHLHPRPFDRRLDRQ